MSCINTWDERQSGSSTVAWVRKQQSLCRLLVSLVKLHWSLSFTKSFRFCLTQGWMEPNLKKLTFCGPMAKDKVSTRRRRRRRGLIKI